MRGQNAGARSLDDFAVLRRPARGHSSDATAIARAASEPLRLVIWTFMPTHHQSAFFAALRDSGARLKVLYLSRVSPERRALGWREPERLPDGEQYVKPRLESLRQVEEWSDHIHLVAGAGSTFLRLLVLRLSMRGVPWVHWSEAATPRGRWSPRSLLRTLYATLVNRRALGAFAIGENARRDFVRWGIDERRIRLLPYSVAALVAPAVPRAERSAPVFAQVGELCHRKGVDVLLRAFAPLARRYPGARLDLVGDGARSAEYQQLASQLQIASAVRFKGAVPAPEVAAHLQRADVLVLASRFDGWGVVLNEGASLGKALIATHATGAAHHLICDGENGFRVSAGDPVALQAALARYCENPGLAEVHGAVSSRIFQDYTPKANAERLRQGLASLLAVG